MGSSWGRNTEEREQIQQSFEPGSPYTDPAPSPTGPAFDESYDGNARDRAPWERVNPLDRRSPEGLVAASYFGVRGLPQDPWQPVQPGSLLYRNSVTGAVQIRRGR